MTDTHDDEYPCPECGCCFTAEDYGALMVEIADLRARLAIISPERQALVDLLAVWRRHAPTSAAVAQAIARCEAAASGK